MQVKKFEAPTMQDALKVIKREMGPDAIILKTKENRKGFGLMSSTSVEVTAAITENDLKKKRLAEKGLPQEVKEKIYSRDSSKQKQIYDSYFDRQLSATQDRVTKTNAARAQRPRVEEEANAQTRAGGNEKYRKIDPTILNEPSTTSDYDPAGVDLYTTPVIRSALEGEELVEDSSGDLLKLQDEVSELRSLVKEISKDRSLKKFVTGGAELIEQEFSETFRDLINSGVDRQIARELVANAERSLGDGKKADYSLMQERVAYDLMERITTVDVLAGVGAKNGKAETTFLSIVGPTGVGKTTTTAKIASQAITERGLRVGIINLDTYRVGAAQQLATYAKLMNLPFRNVKDSEQLHEAIFDFASLDLVLIDTTGRSQKDDEGLNAIGKFLNQIEGQRSLLVLSATTRDSDIKDISNRFRCLHPSALIFSKLDETGVYGSIVNTQLRTTLPLAYFTVGQRVPEDIERATKERVVDLVVDL